MKPLSKILLVNDSKTQQMMIQDMLSDYKVRIAESEQELFDSLDNWKPDLLIINNVLLTGNGYQLTQRIRLESEFDTIPIILTASLDHPVDMEKAYEMGCNSYLTKPFSKEKLLETIGHLYPDTQSLGGMGKILIIDDSKTIRSMIATPFIQAGYEVKQSENGLEALALLQTFKPDIISVDVEMPVMDGFTFCHELRSNPSLKDIPVIIISGTVDYNLRLKGYQSGVIEFFKKPFRSEEIFRYVDQLAASLKIKNNYRVLVVEDALLEQHVMKFALMRGGYEPYVVSSGEEAIEITKSVKFNIILLDIILKGQNGYTVCQHLKENPDTKDTPIIIVTGLKEEYSILKSFEIGASDYINKPFTIEELMARLQVNLKRENKWESKPLAAKEPYLADENSNLYRQILSQLGMIVLKTNVEGKIIFCNGEIEFFTGYTCQEIKNGNWIKMLFSETESRNDLISCFQSAMDLGQVKKSFVTTSKNGTKTYFLWTICHLKAEQNLSEGILLIGYPDSAKEHLNVTGEMDLKSRFITVQQTNNTLSEELSKKEKELELVQEEIKRLSKKVNMAGQAKSEFLSKMSHEMRTPLNAIIGFAQLIARKASPEQEIAKFSERILQSGENLLIIINDILDYAEVVAGHVQPASEACHVKTLVLESLTPLKKLINQKEIELNIDIHDSIGTINTDRQRLAQILNNLISNSIKYNRKGGKVWIRTSLIEGDKILRFEIEDNGIGIPKDKYHKVFSMFEQVDGSYSRENEGTGLGLALTRKLVHLLEGKIWFTSEENTSTHFYFTIPFNRH